MVNIIEEFGKYPAPHIIVASPPCQSFSMAACMKGGNASWRFDTNSKYGIVQREEQEYEGTRYNYDRQIKFSSLGLKCVLNTIKLIQHFKPKYWYIENPERSLLWNVVEHHLEGFSNVAWYCSYGAPYKKPTKFYSNVELELKQELPKQKLISFEYAGSGINRSQIPLELLRDIFKKFK